MTMRLTGQLDISVRNPITLDKFTSFEVAIQTHNPAFSFRSSKTRRRHSEFCWLRKQLKSHHPLSTPPKLPSRRLKLEASDPQFLVQRMKELEDWLYEVIDTTLYLSDTSVHLFLQTKLSCDQIDQYLKGKLPDSVKELAERECDLEADSVMSPSLKDQDIAASQTQTVHEPVHIRSGSSPGRRGDSGLALSSESDIDSSYESSNNSVAGSSESSRHSFPAVTLLDNEAGNQDWKSLKTSPGKQDTKTSFDGQVQTGEFSHGNCVLTKEIDLMQNGLQTIESETQTTDLEQEEVKDEASQTGDLERDINKVDWDRTENHFGINELPVQVGLRCSINTDTDEK